ncbi:MAG TPA: hypothetical protein VEP90_08365 [Methylomirabilota bacterium]|nr:hypothetical protein [Methylomirabilota bacterium]
MDQNTFTLEREDEETKVEETKVQAKPDVETFKSIVAHHLRSWSVGTVEELCTPQTQALIDELAPYFV